MLKRRRLRVPTPGRFAIPGPERLSGGSEAHALSFARSALGGVVASSRRGATAPAIEHRERSSTAARRSRAGTPSDIQESRT